MGGAVSLLNYNGLGGESAGCRVRSKIAAKCSKGALQKAISIGFPHSERVNESPEVGDCHSFMAEKGAVLNP